MSEGTLELKEHQEARWLEPTEWESVDWLPADVEVVKRLG
jgi:8-oxo-dGTP diphosphatase